MPPPRFSTLARANSFGTDSIFGCQFAFGAGSWVHAFQSWWGPAFGEAIVMNDHPHAWPRPTPTLFLAAPIPSNMPKKFALHPGRVAPKSANHPRTFAPCRSRRVAEKFRSSPFVSQPTRVGRQGLRHVVKRYSAPSLVAAITSIKRLLASRRHLKVLAPSLPLSTVASIVVEPSAATTRSRVVVYCGSAPYTNATWSWQNAACRSGLIGLVPVAVAVGAVVSLVELVPAAATGGVESPVAVQPASMTAANARAVAVFIWPLESATRRHWSGTQHRQHGR